MKTSLIITVFNEEHTIDILLNSIQKQTKLPNEIIIVDGGSSDKTISNIQFQISNFKKTGVGFNLITKKGNRAVGRNEAVNKAKNEIILCTDAGCILDKRWVELISEPFKDPTIDVVAGYYRGVSENIFQKSLVPYVLVMEDRVSHSNFLPASRSMAFRRKIWEKVQGFNGDLSHNEDYEFAKKLKQYKAKIFFQKSAIVGWIPRKNFIESFSMFYRFSYGDIEAGIVRPKVMLLFVRYIIGLTILTAFLLTGQYFILNILYLILLAYILWSIYKNYRYVKDIKAYIYLPLIQFTSDLAVIVGSISGVVALVKSSLHNL